jgi:hypothetical protein
MKSAFGSKRKARKIGVDEDDDGGTNNALSSSEQVKTRKFSKVAAMNLADFKKLADEFL